MKWTRIYGVWRSMRTRCENKRDAAYPDYGGRGITVCERWLDFSNFLADLGQPPEGMTLERVDNDGNYELSNCKWVSRLAQSRNRRNVIRITVNGETLCLSEWAERTGIDVRTLWARLKKGWSESAAVTTPKMTNRTGIRQGRHIYEPR
jgi:hypothetical protein